MIASFGVLIAGAALGQMLKVASKPWLIVSATLFLVAIVLLILIVRDQRRAIRVLEETAEHPTAQAVATVETGAADRESATAPAQESEPATAPAGPPHHVATVERGRIAMLGGVVSLIYLVILVLMIWNS